MAELEYGVVRGRYRLVQSNVSRSAEGSVTFTPVEPDEIVDVPGETLFSRQKVDAVFDGDGWIHASGTPVDYLRLPVGRWEVSFRQAKGLSIGTFQFDVAADETVNLPAVAPIKPAPAVKFVVNELVYTETLDARDETFVARDAAVQAAADAAAPTNTVVDARIAMKRGAANGVAALGSDSKLPETQVPDRLSASALSSTIGANAGFLLTQSPKPPGPSQGTSRVFLSTAAGCVRGTVRSPQGVWITNDSGAAVNVALGNLDTLVGPDAAEYATLPAGETYIYLGPRPVFMKTNSGTASVLVDQGAY